MISLTMMLVGNFQVANIGTSPFLLLYSLYHRKGVLSQAVTAELNGVTVVMTIGAAEYTVNGVAKTADVAPFINGASTMVPVRFVAEAFGINVTPIYAENGAVADVLFAK